MTAYTRGSNGEPLLWVSQRAITKSTHPGLLDNTVSGGVPVNEHPFECMIREGAEEASLPEDIVRPRVKAVGTIAYFHIRDERAGGETELLQPEVQYLYECELPADVIPKSCDDEVESFRLYSVEEIKAALERREFKPNYAPVVMDFLIRHGIINEQNEPGYVELVSQLHRRLEFLLKGGSHL